MAKSKWYNWLLNPVGALANNLTQNAKNGSVGSAVGKALNPDKTLFKGFSDLFTKKGRADKVRSVIEADAERAGMSLEEFLRLNPDIAKTYNEADKGILDKITGNKHVNSLIESLTGERDTAENEKNRQFQHDEAQIARDWEEEQARQAREWDSIGAQMERASAVGVNPISIAMQNGGINSSATTSIPSSPGVPSGSSGLLHNGILDIASTVFGGIGTLAENRLKQSQSDDIVAMRKYNIAEKIANTDHLRSLCANLDVSTVTQSIQNDWLDILNQATYDNMLADAGYKNAQSDLAKSAKKLNLKQIDSITQDMSLNLQRFNATLPLELQLTESEINFKNASVQQIYTEISMRHLQAIEQMSRNVQASAEAETAQVQANTAKATFEDAVNAFHNDMVRGAAEAGISLNDYIYYGAKPGSIANVPGSIGILFNDMFRSGKHRKFGAYDTSKDIKGVDIAK